jgi:hypothetical protein
VEAYFAGYGWIEFDPTSMTTESVSRWKVALLSFRKWSQQWAMNAGRWLSLTEDRLQERCGRVWPLLGGAGLALLTLIGVWRWKVHPRSAPTRRPPVVRDQARRQSFRHFDSLCALLRRYGLPRHDHETPFEYAAAMAACVPSVAAQVEVIVQTYVAGRYSDESLSLEQVQASAQAWRTLPPHLRAARRATPRGEWGRRGDG